MMEKQEASVGKITSSFTIPFLIWWSICVLAWKFISDSMGYLSMMGFLRVIGITQDTMKLTGIIGPILLCLIYYLNCRLGTRKIFKKYVIDVDMSEKIYKNIVIIIIISLFVNFAPYTYILGRIMFIPSEIFTISTIIVAIGILLMIPIEKVIIQKYLN